VKSLTVQAPWSWLLTLPDEAGGKGVENRGWPIVHRGTIALHTALKVDRAVLTDPRVREALTQWRGPDPRHADAEPWDGRLGCIVALIDITDCHPARRVEPCCRPWGDLPPIGQQLWHWTRANPRSLSRPVQCRGALGLWTVPADVEALVLERAG